MNKLFRPFATSIAAMALLLCGSAPQAFAKAAAPVKMAVHAPPPAALNVTETNSAYLMDLPAATLTQKSITLPDANAIPSSTIAGRLIALAPDNGTTMDSTAKSALKTHSTAEDVTTKKTYYAMLTPTATAASQAGFASAVPMTPGANLALASEPPTSDPLLM